MEQTLEKKLRHAFNASVPLVAISTPDIGDTIHRIVNAFRNQARGIIIWDLVSGHRPAENTSKSHYYGLPAPTAQPIHNPVDFLRACLNLEPECIVIMYGLQDLIGPHRPDLCTAIFNLRHPFSVSKRMLILLGSQFSIPSSLVNDIIVFDQEYPKDDQLFELAKNLDYEVSKHRPNQKTLTKEELAAAVAAVRGLSLFQAEQHLAMGFTKEGIDLNLLHNLRKTVINATPGLSLDMGKLTFDDVGGLRQILKFAKQRFQGNDKPDVVVRIEEIEKVFLGTTGDLTGISSDALQVLLNAMQDNGWEGLIAFGPPGSGKSLFSQVLANTFGSMAVTFDLNACKDQWVGSSERRIREAIKKIHGLGRDRVFFVATCNGTATLPPELKRRFNYGIWMFDLPNYDERRAIWKIHRRNYNIPDDQPIPTDNDWSGANIRDCCHIANRLRCTLTEAAEYVVPAGRQYRDVIENTRKEALGRYLSASYPGPYRGPEVTTVSSERKIDLN